MHTNLHFTDKNRVIGLDILRSISILLVIMVHFVFFYGKIYPISHELFSFCTVLGVYAVEILFVLSGFLIGGILLRDAFSEPSWKKGYIFFMHRILRILPAYYTVLIVLVLYEIVISEGSYSRIEYFFFMQNYDQGAERFFPISWSLSIEQWSYILAPIVLFTFPTMLRTIHKSATQSQSHSRASEIMASVLFILLFTLLLRTVFVFFFDPLWDSGIRKNIHIRLDAIFFGIFIVCSKNFFPKIYKIMSTVPFFLCIILLLSVFSVYFYRSLLFEPFMEPSFFHKTLGFSIYDALLAMMLPFFASNTIINIRDWRSKKTALFFYYASTYSYSLYLVHYSVFESTTRILMQLNIQNVVLKVTAQLLSIGVALFVILTLATLLHKYVEKPCMDLRKYIV